MCGINVFPTGVGGEPGEAAMTTIYEEIKEVKEVVTKKEVGKVCDWCKLRIDDEINCDDDAPRVLMDIDVTISYPCYDSGTGRTWRVNDLCHKCADKLKGVFIELGIDIEEDDYTW